MEKAEAITSSRKSGHTFFLAARWDTLAEGQLKRFIDNPHSISLDKRLSMKVFKEHLLKNDKWRPMKAIGDIAEHINREGNPYLGLKASNDLPLYGEYCFFYNNMRNLLYNRKDLDADDCKNRLAMIFEYDLGLNEGRHPAYYIYTQNNLGANNTKERNSCVGYRLPISALQLRVYATGIMFLSIHCMDIRSDVDTQGMCEHGQRHHQIYKNPSINMHNISESPWSDKDFDALIKKKAEAEVRAKDKANTEELDQYNFGMKDIVAINHFGRVLFSPFLSKIEKPESEAESVRPTKQAPVYSMLSLDKDICICDYRIGHEHTKPEHMPFLGSLLGESFVSRPIAAEEKYSTQAPIVVLSLFNDDRMYMQGYVSNEVLSDALSKGFERREEVLSNKKRNELCLSGLKAWYAFVMGDSSPSEPTCRNDEIFLRETSNFTYAWWGDWGTFYGITDKACMMVLDTSSPDFLVDNFKWHYFSLFIIAVLQHCSLLRFYEEASGLMRGKMKTKKCTALRKRYMLFLNCIWQERVTAQIQGMEMFEMMRRNMGVERDLDFLDNALEELHAMETIRVEQKQNRVLYALAVFGGFIAAMDLFTGDGLLAKTWEWLKQIFR